MNIEDAGRVVLALEALACVWMAWLAWKETTNERLLFRIVGLATGTAAAVLIIYGLSRS